MGYMDNSEIEKVLANWIAQALDPAGEFAADVDRSKWIANHFLNWWRTRIADDLSDVQGAILGTRRMLELLDKNAMPEVQEALFELTHADEGLASLRLAFKIDDD